MQAREGTEPAGGVNEAAIPGAWPALNAVADAPGLTAGIWPVMVVGAGAAGLMAAIAAGRAGARTLLLESRTRPGAKIRVSGGGRCNVLPAGLSLSDFHTAGSRNTLRNILFSWPLAAVRQYFEADLGIPLRSEPPGKLFPASNRAQDVVRALLAECERAGVKLVGGARVADVKRSDGGAQLADATQGDGDAPWCIALEDGRQLQARRLVLACGGLSLPKTGSDGGGFAIAERLGVPLATTYPALVPLRSGDPRWKHLAGVAVRVTLRAVRAGRTMEAREGDLLFTHRGFSGPVVLDMSRHVTDPAAAGTRLEVCWGSDGGPDWETTLRPAGNRLVVTLLAQHLPARLAGLLLEAAAVPAERRESELTREERRALVEMLVACPLPLAGSEGYAAAEVTGGGVPLAAIHAKTMEARGVPGLHICGEMLDVTGRIGGYNFLWAWVTGRRAGEAAARGAASGH